MFATHASPFFVHYLPARGKEAKSRPKGHCWGETASCEMEGDFVSWANCKACRICSGVDLMMRSLAASEDVG